MTKIRVEISTNNAAFGENAQEESIELARIFRALADRMEIDPSTPFNHPHILDINGNRVGEITKEFS